MYERPNINRNPAFHFSRFAIALFLPALAYFVAGRIGLLLAIPPGFSSAVWPAAGVALSALLLLPCVAATLGVGAGSFLVNLSITTGFFSQINLQSLTVPFFISLGAMAQVLFGFFLMRRFVSKNNFIETPSEVLRFTFVVAPVGCVIAPLVGTSALFGFGIIGSENFPFTAFTWWIGDTIGILFFTPLILAIFAGSDELSSLRKKQIILPSLALFVAIIALFGFSTSVRFKVLTSELEESSQQYFSKIEERIRVSENMLLAFTAFYQNSDYVSKDEFESFSETMLENNAGFLGIGWTEIVSNQQRQAYENKITRETGNEFYFREFDEEGNLRRAQQRKQYYPVLNIYPFETNSKAWGLDLGSNPQRLAALVLAKAEKTVVSTAPILLAQETGQEKSIILYYPVFKKDKQHQNEFIGYVSGVLRFVDTLRSVLSEAQSNQLALEIFDVTDKSKVEEIITSNQVKLAKFEKQEKYIEIGTRKWKITLYPTTGYKVSSKDWASWSILTIGILSASLLQAFILTITGTTENIQKEVTRKTKDLQKAKLEAERANAAKSQFLANVNHEIRTPLNAIKGMLTLCLKTELNTVQRGYLDNAKIALHTLLGLINQTLDFSKIEAGKMELDTQKFDFHEVLQGIYAMFILQAQEKNLQFDIKLKSPIPSYIYGDRLRLEQVLMNLCGNAFKFTDSGYVELIVGARKIDSNTANGKQFELDIAVCDTGIGLSNDQMEKLFQTFQQADSSTTRKYGGTGLGLAISKQLVELMEGKIEAESKEGSGSIFRLTLPVNCDTAQSFNSVQHFTAPPENISPDQNAELINSKLNGLTILVVEDNQLNQEIVQFLLEDNGAKVSLANNGQEAIDYLASHSNISLILMDMQMPVMDGISATIELRKQHQFDQLPIIALTANVTTDDINKCKSAGMNGYVSKPIEEETLLEEILRVKTS